MSYERQIEPTRETTGVVIDRGIAQLIDAITIIGISVALAALLSISGRFELFVVSALVVFAYNTALEGFWHGQTLGKRLMEIRVVDERGTAPSPAQAATRNVPGVIPIAGILLLIAALVAIASTDRRQRVFDLVADTFVVEIGPPR